MAGTTMEYGRATFSVRVVGEKSPKSMRKKQSESAKCAV